MRQIIKFILVPDDRSAMAAFVSSRTNLVVFVISKKVNL